MSEHAYDPTREGAPQMCRCGNAYRTRAQVKAHVRQPEPEPVVVFPAYIAPADEPADRRARSLVWDCGCGRQHRALCLNYEYARRAA